MHGLFKKIVLGSLFCLISLPSYAIVAGGIVSIQHTWPAHSEFNKLTFFQQINQDGGAHSRYYWANMFYFNNGSGYGSGYIGLQNRGHGVHAFNYSIWEAKGWKSGHCGFFNHEGSGVQCQIEIPWKIGHQYQLDVIKKGNLVTGIVTDLMNGAKTTVGVIEVPSTFGKFYASSGFVEEYSQGNEQPSSCFMLGPQSSTFSKPIGDDRIKAKQSTYSYGNCNKPSVVQTTCNDDVCINAINNFGGGASPAAPEVAFVNEKDITAQSLAKALKTQDFIVIRSQNGSWAPRIFFPSPRSFQGKSIFVDHRADYNSSIYVNGRGMRITKGQQLTYMSDGKYWKIVEKR
ncbi:DUF3472 domain-containing protein [Bartonella gliris]|uniref:DUF3472 domain-containing protein n=1 Tax=Bartonella gliris TaxID=3004109 RepID=UPI00295EF596|nr:DUF3472 domain-containing protein [Bartonella gliris]